jgi:phosphotriesterase-related protein
VIETVLGPLAAEDLGRCSMHDHLLSDARMLHSPAPVPAPDGDRVTVENLGFLRWHLLALADNLVLDDPQLAARELGHAAAGGLGGLVELSTWGLGGCPAQLPAISRATGVTVIAGCGVYLDRPHPSWVSESSSDQLSRRFTVALTDELDGAGFRAGLIGIVGTSEPMTASEARRGHGGSLRPRRERVELAATGATLEWCFGNESRTGVGYEHLQRIVGELARRGISARDIDTMLVANPARLLDR